ncbi:MAG: hypothetical protein M3280_07495 [Actinomycetota bacterium]|nr:hypothetical protein [Actinomycetota bacterium]
MRRVTILSAIFVAAVTTVAFYIQRQSQPLPFGRDDVVSIWLEPYPEGPNSPAFALRPSGSDRPLANIEESIPSPLPRDVWQGVFYCEFGGNVVVELASGDRIEYGPCRRPASIEGMRRAILDALM